MRARTCRTVLAEGTSSSAVELTGSMVTPARDHPGYEERLSAEYV